MMGKLSLALVALTCSCDPQLHHYSYQDAGQMTDASPDAGPLLWSDANLVLAEAWCDLGVRCGAGDYAFLFGSGSGAHASCVQTLSDELCYGEWEGVEMCESLYPTGEHLTNLRACPADSAAVDCTDGDLYWVLSCNLAAPWTQGT